MASPPQTPVPPTTRPIRANTPPAFNIGVDDGTQRFLEHLAEHGFAVVAGAAPQHRELRDSMWEFLERRGEEATVRVRRSDPGTWTPEDGWLGSETNGIIANCGIGQAPFMWRLRLLPKVTEAFAAIWGCAEDELLTSFDGANVFRPWRRDPSWITKGLVTLCDATAETGGLVVVPGSHRVFRDVCERNADARHREASEASDYIPIDAADEVLAAGGQMICASAGDLIVWDSRTIHCNTPALDAAPDSPPPSNTLAAPTELLRMVGYVCMTPASWATPEVLCQRWDAFIHHATTTHWPHTFTGGSHWAAPRNDPATLSALQRRLIGGQSEPPVLATDELLSEAQGEARRLVAKAEEAEARGDVMAAVRMYKRAFKLDPSLE